MRHEPAEPAIHRRQCTAALLPGQYSAGLVLFSIFVIADVFDALTSTRPYKPAWPVEKAVALIVEQSGRHFDPALVAHFQQQLPEFLRIRAQWHEPDDVADATQGR